MSEPLNTGLLPEVHTLESGETFQWSDEYRQDLVLEPGDRVIVLTDEGALRRGCRRWHPGAIGTVVSRRKDAGTCGWMVDVNGFVVLIFSDEMRLP